MRDNARKAVEMASSRTREDLDSDEMLRLALTHLVELVGEAANQVPADVQTQYPQVPWQDVIAMRHRLVHGYDSIDYGILWDTVRTNLPALVVTIERIVGTPEL